MFDGCIGTTRATNTERHSRANVEQFLDDMEVLPEDVSTTRRLMDLIGARSAAGRPVHDANVLAMALAHQASVIVTDNTRHFSRFADLIGLESLGTASA